MTTGLRRVVPFPVLGLLFLALPAMAVDVQRWEASDLPDGPVTSWVSQGSLATPANLTAANEGNPTKDADGVFFDGDDALEIPAGLNFLAGDSAWTVTVVFKAVGSQGEGGSTKSSNPDPNDPSRWWSNAGLVGHELFGADEGDWGLFLNSEHEAVIGNGGAPSTGFVLQNTPLNDGCVHVMTGVFNVSTGSRQLYLDGVQIADQSGLSINSPAGTIHFGVNILTNPQVRAYFTGRFSTVILTDEALTATEVIDLQYSLGASRVALPADLPLGTFSTANAFPGLTFTDPVAIVAPPGETNRLFVVEQIGRISVIPDLASPTKQTFLDIQTIVDSDSNEEGLLGLAFHPNYNNTGQPGFGEFFVYYIITDTIRHWRLSRFQVSAGDPNVADAASEQAMITQLDQDSNHNGGDLHFGNDGYLYLSVGDEGSANDVRDNGQHIDKDFFAGVFRIDVDRLPGNLEPNAHPSIELDGASTAYYKVPADNPFVGVTSFNGSLVTPANVRTEIWAIGMRNPWRMSFDRPTGRLFVADVGQSNPSYEEVNILSPAVFATNSGIPNYGWSFREAFHPFVLGPGGAAPPAGFSSIDPIHEYPRSLGQSITGGLVYRGSQYPELTGNYLFADYISGRIWSMDDPGGPSQSVTEIANDNQIAAFGINPFTGDVLLADDNSNRLNDDQIKRLVRNAGAGLQLPQFLSQTGAFSNLATLTPETGIHPYAINVPFWSDHAIKSRWFTLPGNSGPMTFSDEGNWTFPKGQTWIKHFDLDLDRDNPGTSVRRVETRFLVKTTDDVYGITFRWNDAQTDAELVAEDGLTEDFTITEGGEEILQTWIYPSRADCRTCHTLVGGGALSFNTRQLNRNGVSGGVGGLSENQIEALSDAGYFQAPVTGVQTMPAFAAPDDTTKSLEYRVRSYLAVNCVQCHQPGGPSTNTWDARAMLSLENTGLVNGEATNNGGDLLNKLIVPGSEANSVLLHRLQASGGFTRMPSLGSNVPDETSIQLVKDWINLSLPGRQFYGEWRFAEFGSGSSSIGEKGSDANGDGEDNYFEFLTGQDPFGVDEIWQPSMTITGTGAIRFDLERFANLGMQLIASDDLEAWWFVDVTGNDLCFGSANGPDAIEMPFDPESMPRRFFRWLLTEP